jgi:putative ABC transport system permease protein
VTEVCVQSVTVAGRPTTGIAYRRLTGLAIHPAIVSGRAPRTAREVALGQSTLDELHGRVGDRITIRGRDRALTYRVVGRAAFPTLGPAQPLADGVAFTSAGYAPLFDQNLFNRFFVGRIAPGADRARLRATIDAVPQLSPLAPAPLPGEIDRLRQIDWLPITLAALIAGFAALALAHTLLTAIRRRRSELAVLKTLGFRPGQIRATIASQATTFAVLGAVVGLPVGVLSGALVWRAVADGLGVATATTVPLLGLVAIAAAAVAVANVVALWPARRAARMRPAPALAAD